MRNAATAAFVALGLIWGSNFIFMKWASETLTAGQMTLLRVVFGSSWSMSRSTQWTAPDSS